MQQHVWTVGDPYLAATTPMPPNRNLRDLGGRNTTWLAWSRAGADPRILNPRPMPSLEAGIVAFTRRHTLAEGEARARIVNNQRNAITGARGPLPPMPATGLRALPLDARDNARQDVRNAIHAARATADARNLHPHFLPVAGAPFFQNEFDFFAKAPR